MMEEAKGASNGHADSVSQSQQEGHENPCEVQIAPTGVQTFDETERPRARIMAATIQGSAGKTITFMMDNASDSRNETVVKDMSDSSSDSNADAGTTKRKTSEKPRNSRSQKKKKSVGKGETSKKSRSKSKAAESTSESEDSSDSDDSGSGKVAGGSSSRQASRAALNERIVALESQLSLLQLPPGQGSSEQGTGPLPWQPSHPQQLAGMREALKRAQQSNPPLMFGGPSIGPPGTQIRPPTVNDLGYVRGPPVTRHRPLTDGISEVNNPERSKGNKKPGRPEFKRVDWVWDSSLFTYKLQDTAKPSDDSHYDGYVFHVRRTFDCEGKYRKTFVDIKSKLLRECLQDVIKNVQGVSLVDEVPKLDPNLLFLYLEDFRLHYGALKELEPAGDSKKERKRNQKRLDNKRRHLKVLIKYLDNDYAKIKNSLGPMLQNGIITYELLWALWKPGTLCYYTTYGSTDCIRAFKVDTAERHETMIKGDFYFVTGRYFEFDGKRFGYAGISEEIPKFRGARKITSLPCYPLSYCHDEDKIREDLIERGKKFVALSGVHFKAYSGMAYMKRKKAILRYNVTSSRIMIDSSIFRRINPNYGMSPVRPKSHEVVSLSSDSSEAESDDGDSSSIGSHHGPGNSKDKSEYVMKAVKDSRGRVHMLKMLKDDLPGGDTHEQLEELPEDRVVGAHDTTTQSHSENKGTVNGDTKASVKETSESRPASSQKNRTNEQNPSQTQTTTANPIESFALELSRPYLTDEEYLLASPVVLGFAFAEKQWLEFEVASISDIKWNDDAWDSLVLEPKTKDLIKALVESRKFKAATTIDDVIQGKGKGLVTVLHGPPGTGKTLTAEGISELLKCPLYMASAGELGTDSRLLEHELQKILDICHTWGAILLLDEADVFLEKRNMSDIHRNALVSIFLRQLEYFQGILFLTTNRVETFDEAFQSRIHIALRYDRLDAKAKKAIFEMFLNRVRAHGKMEMEPFTEEDLNSLARKDLNGREIKNVLGSAQDLAANNGEALSMRHMKQVLDVHAKFGQDLKGGSGFEDAMRSYF